MSTIAFFRPADDRAESAAEFIGSLGAEPLSDPMLAVEPTGDTPRTDAAITILTSKTGAELVAETDWTPGGELAAIGTPTAEALEAVGYTVDRLPSEFSSSGLVSELGADAPGASIEVARSDHGSDVLTDGLNDAGAYVHETVLYRLVRPDGAGASTVAAAEGDLGGVCFTSSLTVEHFLAAADDRGLRREAIDGLNRAVVGAIGEPTRETAEALGVDVDVVPETAQFDALAEAVVDRL
ncbi:uroporphyrinogen-III synthase [Natronomonas salsuginis]|uniref:Uroporphyrinogen-III synthase n=1 Tax=Natronomonas salsuginis TaxID=2217661 RepID=A0A4U5JAP9_9EURY|nr:uroporphyrinogen-III synthase [Natronomonas salsuginis]TKR24587.1 uroporphyrinogen-III synthase [Natronomonas salsuginis]